MLGDIIKNARKNKRIMQKELADMMDVRPSTVSMWESGDRTPELETLIKLSEILDIPFSDIMDEIFGDQKKEAPAVNGESRKINMQLSIDTREGWIARVSALTPENQNLLREYTEFLLARQAQADQVKK